MARKKVVKTVTQKRAGGIYTTTYYSDGTKSTHVERTEAQKESLIESARRRTVSGRKSQARRIYDESIKSINGSLRSAYKDKEYGTVSGDVQEVREILQDTFEEADVPKNIRRDLFPKSSQLSDEDFAKFFYAASNVAIPKGQKVAESAYPGLRRSYRRAYSKVQEDMLQSGKMSMFTKAQLDTVTRIALGANKAWKVLRKEDDHYFELQAMIDTFTESPNLDPVDILNKAYDEYKAGKKKIPITTIINRIISRGY